MSRIPTYQRLGILAIGAGSALILFQMLIWFYAQTVIGSIGIPGGEQVLRFFLLELISLLLIMAGSYSLYRAAQRMPEGEKESWRLAEVLQTALSSKRDVRFGMIAGILYGVFYAVVSSVVVYQPGVDFAQAYGAASPSWSAVSCCGGFGTIPMILVYLAPQTHLGLQLIPLDLLFLVVIPILISFNSTVTAFAFRNRPKRMAGGWLGGFGAMVALFTSCPTCAGYFLGSSFGGFAAASLAVALAPYQLAFVIVSIPVLILSPVLVANSTRKALLANCRIDG